MWHESRKKASNWSHVDFLVGRRRIRSRYFLLIISLLFATLDESSLHAQQREGGITTDQVPGGPLSEVDAKSLKSVLNQVKTVLESGLDEGWRTRERYYTSLEGPLALDPKNDKAQGAKTYVRCLIEKSLRVSRPWDEGMPIEVKVHRLLADMSKLLRTIDETRNQDATEGKVIVPLCIASSRGYVEVAPGVAEKLIKAKVAPQYPADLLSEGNTATVMIHATINMSGDVVAATAVGGPSRLRRAAVDAVKQWKYRPYRLNGAPVEFTTTIRVAFGNRSK